MPRSTHVVRSASLNGYVELATSLGLDARTLMRRAGLSIKSLEDPETPISVAAVRRLLEASAKAAGTEDFGTRLASKRRLSNLGPISLVLREQANGRQALDTLYRYLRLLNASLLTRIEDHDDVVVIREQFLVGKNEPIWQSIQLAVGVMYRILAELLGPSWRARRVYFAHRAPTDLTAHRALFGRNMEFDADWNGIVCARKDLERPLSRSDPDMARFATRYLDQMLNQSRPDTRDVVRRLIAALLPGGRCTADQVAQHLGVDRRTIHRYLRAESASFMQLLTAVRSELAIRQIQDSNASLAEIADLLGFSSASTLAHWFRTQYGCSVTQWRRRNPNKRGD